MSRGRVAVALITLGGLVAEQSQSLPPLVVSLNVLFSTLPLFPKSIFLLSFFHPSFINFLHPEFFIFFLFIYDALSFILSLSFPFTFFRIVCLRSTSWQYSFPKVAVAVTPWTYILDKFGFNRGRDTGPLICSFHGFPQSL
jgi:hypothetical protein